MCLLLLLVPDHAHDHHLRLLLSHLWRLPPLTLRSRSFISLVLFSSGFSAPPEKRQRHLSYRMGTRTVSAYFLPGIVRVGVAEKGSDSDKSSAIRRPVHGPLVGLRHLLLLLPCHLVNHLILKRQKIVNCCTVVDCPFKCG